MLCIGKKSIKFWISAKENIFEIRFARTSRNGVVEKIDNVLPCQKCVEDCKKNAT